MGTNNYVHAIFIWFIIYMFSHISKAKCQLCGIWNKIWWVAFTYFILNLFQGKLGFFKEKWGWVLII